MSPFSGFPEGKTRQVRIPEQFFRELLLQVDHLGELILTLYVFWRLEHMEGAFRYLRWAELIRDDNLMQSMEARPAKALAALEDALKRAVIRGTLLLAILPLEEGDERLIFLNSPKGRAAIQAIQQGDWRLIRDAGEPMAIYQERPNIFQLYESNIGPLTPMIADALRDAESTYSPAWIEEAIRIAVEHNKHNWRYVEAILRRWQEEGRDDKKGTSDRRDSEEARRRYAEWEQ